MGHRYWIVVREEGGTIHRVRASQWRAEVKAGVVIFGSESKTAYHLYDRILERLGYLPYRTTIKGE